MPASALLPAIPLAPVRSPIEELQNLRQALGGGPRLLIKRDDCLPFAFGGNKVRKMQLVAADAIGCGADTLITSGGIQSNHARVTAAAAAKLGLRCILVVNGTAAERPTANALLDQLLGAHQPERRVLAGLKRERLLERLHADDRQAGSNLLPAAQASVVWVVGRHPSLACTRQRHRWLLGRQV